LARNDVAGTQSDRSASGQQDVSGANPHAQRRPYPAFHQGSFQHQRPPVSSDATGHGAALRTDPFHHCIKNVLKSGQLCDRRLQGSHHHFVGCALRNDASGIEDDGAFSQGENFLPAVRDVENGNEMTPVPLAQVIDDAQLDGGVQGSQGLVQEQNLGVEHQGPRQRNPLALAAGNFTDIPLGQMGDMESVQDGRGTLRAFCFRQVG